MLFMHRDQSAVTSTGGCSAGSGRAVNRSGAAASPWNLVLDHDHLTLTRALSETYRHAKQEGRDRFRPSPFSVVLD
jgi:hypothetical protein